MRDDTSISTPKTILRTARELSDPERQVEYLRRVCGKDNVLFERLLGQLNEKSSQSGASKPTLCSSGKEIPAGELTSDAGEGPLPSSDLNHFYLGQMIGPYKLREQLGEGGMGVVYVAEQLTPVQRLVALKIIKPGMDSKEVIARFEAERQVLAMMDHPNIAKIYDAGVMGESANSSSEALLVGNDRATEPKRFASPSGRQPFFAMELVKGQPITEFCNSQQFDTRQRLELFVTVCQAVQHAHHKGIIHRDLKPSNVLVELHDVTAVPKVIDFGVAKAMNQRLSDQTVYTHFSQLIGTPMYMSPEQAKLSALDVDTRSDVYALGVLLYELLTGTTPFEKSELKKKGLDDMLQVIREVDPPRPSQKVSTLNAELASTVASNRRTESHHRLAISLKRELDWIVMRALEKDRNRRYQSAMALAHDIEHYLRNEPVRACPPSVAYRLRKYISRHRTLLTTAALVLLTAIAGSIISFSYGLKAYREKEKADGLLRVAEQNAQKAAQAKQETDLLLYAADMKLASDAIEAGDTVRATELLERHLPKAGQTDNRGFEWFLLDSQVRKPSQQVLEIEEMVTDAKFSPDGSWLLTNDKDGRVNIYETTGWTLQGTMQTGTDSINGLAWSADGQRIAAACFDGSVQVFKFPEATLDLKITAHEGEVKSVMFSHDGERLFTCGDDGFARQWNLETEKEVKTYAGHKRGVEQLSLSPNGRWLATASSDSTFAIWDTKTGKRFDGLGPHPGRTVCVAFSADSTLVAAGTIYGYLYIYDLENRRLLEYPRFLDGIEAVQFFGDQLLTADRGGAIQILNLPQSTEGESTVSGTPVRRWVGHSGRAQALACIPDQGIVVSGGRDEKIRIWQLSVEAIRWQLARGENTEDLTFTPNGLSFLAGNDLSVWDLTERKVKERWAGGNGKWELIECSQDGRFLAAVRWGELALFELASKKKVNSWPLDEDFNPHRLAIAADGSMVALADYNQRKSVGLYFRGDKHPPRRLLANSCEALTFSPSLRWLASSNSDDLKLFDLQGRQPPQIITGHSDSLSAVAFSPDETYLATASHDRLLRIYHFPEMKLAFSQVAHRDWVRSMIFSPDGRTIITGGKDRRIRFWHTATGQPLGSLPKETFEFYKLAISADGRRLGVVPRGAGNDPIIYDTTSVAKSP